MTLSARVASLVAGGLIAVSSSAWADERGSRACAQAAEDGQLARIESRLRAARGRFLVCARDGCPPLVRRDCLAWLDEVERQIPTIVFALQDPSGAPLTDVRVTMDGERIAERLEGKAVAVDPGEHVFRWERAGAPPETRKLTVHQGEKSRLVDLTFRTPAAGAPPSEPQTASPPAGRPSKALAYTLGAAGVVAIGVGAYLGIDQLNRTSELRSTCGANSRCDPRDVDAIRDQRLAAGVTLGAGVVALAVAAVLLFWPGPGATATSSGGTRAW